MKKHVKFIIGFILGALLFGTAGVYAATIILSKDVSYDNSKSKMESSNVQDAIDEVISKMSSSSLNDSDFFVFEDNYVGEWYTNYKKHTYNIENDCYLIFFTGWHGQGNSFIKIPPNFVLNGEKKSYEFHSMNSYDSQGYYIIPLNKGDIFEYTANFGGIQSSSYYIMYIPLIVKK